MLLKSDCWRLLLCPVRVLAKKRRKDFGRVLDVVAWIRFPVTIRISIMRLTEMRRRVARTHTVESFRPKHP